MKEIFLYYVSSTNDAILVVWTDATFTKGAFFTMGAFWSLPFLHEKVSSKLVRTTIEIRLNLSFIMGVYLKWISIVSC